MLKPEAKRKWVTAARSGQYPQTREKLKAIKDGVECYCILGILCEASGIGEWKIQRDKVFKFDSGGSDWSTSEATDKVMEWAFDDGYDIQVKDLSDPAGFIKALTEIIPDDIESNYIRRSFNDYTVTELLAKANDAGASLEAIAQVIEDYL